MRLTRESFEKLALEQMDMLYRMARRLTREVNQAEDLVQETYLRAFKSWDKFDLQQFGIRPWLVRIMHNLHVSRAQREQRQPSVTAPENLEIVPDDFQSLPLSPGSFEGMDQRMVKALGQLPSEYQTVLLLWAVEEFSYKEIADAVGVPIGTVMSRLHRARQRLGEQLRELAKEHGVIRE
jgi:RNA polymerase sigma-70 factor (ECF subfamily)